MAEIINFFNAKELIKKKQIKNFYIFTGDDENLKREILFTLRENLSHTNADRIEQQNFSALESSIEEIILAVRSSSFFSETNLITIWNCDNLPLKFLNEIKSFITNPVSGNYVIFVFDNEGKRRKKAEYLCIDDLQKFSSKHLQTIHCVISTESEIQKYIKETVKKQGKDIENNALLKLSAYSKNTLLLAKEIEKIITYIGDKNTINSEDLSKIIVPTIEDNVFKLVKNIFSEKKQNAFQILSDLLANKIAPLNLLNVLLWQCRLIWQAKYLLEEGYFTNYKNIYAEIKTIPEEIMNNLPSKKNLFKNATYSIEQAFVIAKATSKQKIYFMLEKIYETDLILKGINFKIDDKTTLGILLANLLEDGDAVITSRSTAKN